MHLPDIAFFTGIINAYLPEPHATILNGIVFGRSIADQYELYEMVKRTGLLHIVVLSGMNITILSIIISNATVRLGKNLSLVLLTILIAFFVILVTPQAPIVRAVIMCYVTMVAFVMQRAIKPIVALFVSAITIGIFWPEWITSISFLLSFFSTLGIILFLSNGHENINIDNHLKRLVGDDLKTSFAAQIMTVPLIWLYFQEISFIAPFSTLLVAPFIAPLMIMTFIAVFLGSIHFALGYIPGLICFGITSVILTIIELLAKIPYIFFKL